MLHTRGAGFAEGNWEDWRSASARARPLLRLQQGEQRAHFLSGVGRVAQQDRRGAGLHVKFKCSRFFSPEFAKF